MGGWVVACAISIMQPWKWVAGDGLRRAATALVPERPAFEAVPRPPLRPPAAPATCPATHVGRPTAGSPARAVACTRHPVAGPAGDLDAQGKRDAHWADTGHRHLDIGTALPACEHADRGCYSACVAAAASAIAQSHRRTAAPYMARRGTSTAVHRAARKAAYGPFSRGIARPCILRKPTGSSYWYKGGHGGGQAPAWP